MKTIRKLLGIPTAILGALITVMSVVLLGNDVQQLLNLNPWYWGGIGIVIFAGSAIGMLWEMQRRIELETKPNIDPKQVQRAPAPEQIPPSAGEPRDQAEALNRLYEEAEWAVHRLFNAEGVPLAALRQAEQEWRFNRVIPLMHAAGCSMNDVSRFRTLGTFKVIGIGGTDAKHMQFREEVNARIERLRDAADAVEDSLMD